MANGMATVMADSDGNCNGRQWRRRQCPTARATGTATDGNATEMAVAMVHGNRSNGPRQQQRRWAIAMATVTVTVMATATAMARATAMESESESEMVTKMAKETATVRATMKEGLPLHMAAMCSTFRWATPCLDPHGHKESSFTNAASWG
jgi:hypothetical protein